MDMAGKIADRLIKDGKISRGLIGIGLQTLTPVLARQLGIDPKLKGVVVSEVLAGSPAAKAGLQDGDVVTTFDGNPALNEKSLRNMLYVSEIGKDFDLVYLREGKEKSTKVALVPAEDLRAQVVTTRRPAPEKPKKFDLSSFGLEVQELTPELAKQFGIADDAKGGRDQRGHRRLVRRRQRPRSRDADHQGGQEPEDHPGDLPQATPGTRHLGQRADDPRPVSPGRGPVLHPGQAREVTINPNHGPTTGGDLSPPSSRSPNRRPLANSPSPGPSVISKRSDQGRIRAPTAVFRLIMLWRWRTAVSRYWRMVRL